MSDLAPLPVDPDEGFPQSFLLAFGGQTYGVTWYVDIAESELPDPRTSEPTLLIDLTGASATGSDARAASDAPPRGILVLSVDRHDPGGVTTLLRRRVIPGLSYPAGQLLLVVRAAAVALGNLNGSGSFGSVLDVQVGTS
jgi:hypothetical protein